MHPTAVMMRLTLSEMRRRRLLWVVGIVGASYIALYGVGLWFIHRELASSGEGAIAVNGVMTMLLTAGLYVIQFLVVVFAAVISVDSMAGEIASGTLHTVVTKPVRRSDILLGKIAGHALVVCVFAAAMTLAAVGVAMLIGAARPPGLAQAIALVSLEGIVVLAVSYFAGALTGTMATGLVVFGLYGAALVGSWIERIGAIANNVSAQYVGILASLVLPTEALWQRAAAGLLPPILRETAGLFTPFTAANPPSAAMVGYALVYVIVAVALAARAFERRDL